MIRSIHFHTDCIVRKICFSEKIIFILFSQTNNLIETSFKLCHTFNKAYIQRQDHGTILETISLSWAAIQLKQKLVFISIVYKLIKFYTYKSLTCYANISSDLFCHSGKNFRACKSFCHEISRNVTAKATRPLQTKSFPSSLSMKASRKPVCFHSSFACEIHNFPEKLSMPIIACNTFNA